MVRRAVVIFVLPGNTLSKMLFILHPDIRHHKKSPDKPGMVETKEGNALHYKALDPNWQLTRNHQRVLPKNGLVHRHRDGCATAWIGLINDRDRCGTHSSSTRNRDNISGNSSGRPRWIR